MDKTDLLEVDVPGDDAAGTAAAAAVEADALDGVADAYSQLAGGASLLKPSAVQGIHVIPKAGLFPAPWPGDKLPPGTELRFFVLGVALAKCLQVCIRGISVLLLLLCISLFFLDIVSRFTGPRMITTIFGL